MRSGRRGWTPPPRISIPEWADRYRMLAREAGNHSGQWRTSTVEIARGPMLAVTEPGVRTLTAMVATQLLKTSLLENIIGFHVHLDPCSLLIVQPKEAAALQFSKERITPLINATPVLKELIGATKTRDAGDTLDYKAFPGGFLALVGAGSPDNLARRPVRIVLYDEVDKYLPIREGNPIDIGDERMASFGTKSLSVRVCSPTLPDESKIEASYGESDQRRASVACPHCGHRQFLEFFDHVEWDRGADGKTHLPATAAVHCEACGAAWSEGQRLRSLATIRWHQTRPFDCCGQRQVPLSAYGEAWRGGVGAVERIWDWWAADRHAVYRAKCGTCGSWAVPNDHAGFQAGKLYSPWPNDAPPRITRKWLNAQGDEGRRQVFFNTQLAKTYRPNTGKAVDAEGLIGRCEVWPADVPDGVAAITYGVDVQDYRVEVETVGWGRNEESWSLGYEVFEGEFDDPALQARLDEHLAKVWHRADGMSFTGVAACIDSGGHHTTAVYDFAKARLSRRIWAIKGESARTGQRNPVWPVKRPTSRSKKSFRPIIIGVNAAKDTIRSYLARDRHGPGFMHFPRDRDANYFAQLTAERVEVKELGGHRYRVWVLPEGRANEALDCRVYAYAALHGLLHMGFKLNRRADEVGATAAPDEPDEPDEPDKDGEDEVAEERPLLPTPKPKPVPASPPTGPRVIVEQASPDGRRRSAGSLLAGRNRS